MEQSTDEALPTVTPVTALPTMSSLISSSQAVCPLAAAVALSALALSSSSEETFGSALTPVTAPSAMSSLTSSSQVSHPPAAVAVLSALASSSSPSEETFTLGSISGPTHVPPGNNVQFPTKKAAIMHPGSLNTPRWVSSFIFNSSLSWLISIVGIFVLGNGSWYALMGQQQSLRNIMTSFLLQTKRYLL